jgi:hypothetical protein
MKKVLTMKQIEDQFSGEWVLLVNPVQTEDSEIVRGELIFHSKDRSEVYREALKRKDDLTAVFYVGSFPKIWWRSCELSVRTDCRDAVASLGSQAVLPNIVHPR